MSAPLSTYRVQFRPEFGFDDAAAIAEYLADLGITHLYASPYLQAAPGSTHGYDVVDHSRPNEELGGRAGHSRMSEALRTAGVGQVLDIVPNHMAIPGRENQWWWDVLKHGADSRYAGYFDIDWNPPEGKLRGTVLVPVLGDHYGRVLEAGDIKLDQADDGFVVRYFDNEFPVDPDTIEPLLTDHDNKAAEVIQRVNDDADALGALLDAQNYRLAYWRVASAELDYRRFFDINTLVALRSEREEVFHDTHGFVLGLIKDGVLDGVRIDHIDGLSDPLGYLRRLRAAAGPDTWITVEKILEPEERLPASWPIAGTTGYDAMYRIGGLFIEPVGERPITELYCRFTGQEKSWDELVRMGKEYVVRQILHSDVARLTNLLVKICESHRRYRDYTRGELRAVLEAFLVSFPVYRTYVVPQSHQVTRADEEVVAKAVHLTRERHPDLDGDLVRFLAGILTLEFEGELESDFVTRFQQLSGPVMAKGVEDTAFYRYNRLVTLNEVGGDPGHFAVRPDDFHESCAETQRLWPATMVSSTTHDTKRSEDVRYRIALLSQIPDQWAAAVERWSAINERHRRPVDPSNPDGERWPDRDMEYLLYETMVGAHPLDTGRALQYAEKASREAKLHTSWLEPNPAYDDALRSFIEAIGSNKEFLEDLERFVEPLIAPGRVASLAATLLKLTSPGIPDTYQGTELWDLSLVDPDNRRPVDYGDRRRLLAELKEGLSPEEILARSDEGLPKLHVVHEALHLRQRRPECFDQRGGYEPLIATGSAAVNTTAFSRGGVVTVIPRLTLGMDGWGDTALELPDGSWRNILTGDEVGGGKVLCGNLLDRFPVALLEAHS